MKKLRFWGATIAIVSFGLLTCLWFLFDGDRFGLSTDAQRLRASLVVASICLVLLVAKDGFAPMWRKRQDKAQQPLRPSVGMPVGPSSAGPSGLSALRTEQRIAHGFRWRYRQPWLLLTGDDAAIARLLPELAEQGWLITPDAVLLWSKANKEGWPDADWLKQLSRLRRRRPVDAVILTTDSAADLQAQRRGTHPHGMRLARIAELLRWSAPVYLLDVAEARTVGHGLMPVISCELPRQADAALGLEPGRPHTSPRRCR